MFYNTTSLTAGDPDYDHIVPVIRIDSNYSDGLYHPDDIIYISDNGESACISAKDKLYCNDTTPKFVYNYTVS